MERNARPRARQRSEKFVVFPEGPHGVAFRHRRLREWSLERPTVPVLKMVDPMIAALLQHRLSERVVVVRAYAEATRAVLSLHREVFLRPRHHLVFQVAMVRMDLRVDFTEPPLIASHANDLAVALPHANEVFPLLRVTVPQVIHEVAAVVPAFQRPVERLARDSVGVDQEVADALEVRVRPVLARIDMHNWPQ